uniref:Secreted protein n=1 Tax=Caenorhabditis japonica TaxID=281687 RepID=A0A8R1EFN0_CAEJA
MQLTIAVILSFLASISESAAVTTTTTLPTVECDIVEVSGCTVTCGGGFQLMKYVCVDDVKVCLCPKNPIYYQCNNRPCLSASASLLDKFYDAEDQNAEEGEYVYVDEDNAPLINKNH